MTSRYGKRMLYAPDPNQVLLFWIIYAAVVLLALILTFLFIYWIIRLGVAHGMRSFKRWERSGEN